MARTGWQVILPVKRTHEGKSRLSEFAGARRSELATAVALDTITAALACVAVARLIVVTDDDLIRAEAIQLGATVVADPGGGLNAALRGGADVAVLAAEVDSPNARLAALQGDLPALRAADLDAALTVAARYERAFVPDADGTGTTLLTALRRSAFEPAFGADSRSAHRQRGFVELVEADRQPAWLSLRRDVDTYQSLRDAALIGLGSRTKTVLELLDQR